MGARQKKGYILNQSHMEDIKEKLFFLIIYNTDSQLWSILSLGIHTSFWGVHANKMIKWGILESNLVVTEKSLHEVYLLQEITRFLSRTLNIVQRRSYNVVNIYNQGR